MTRTVKLTVTLQLDVSTDVSSAEFYDTLPNRLRTGLGTLLPAALDDVTVVAATDPECILSKPTDLQSMLQPHDEVPFIWSTEDVREVRPDLSHDEAYLVLQTLRRYHDANFGVNWDTIAVQAESLFGESPESAL